MLGRGYICHIEKMNSFLKSSSLLFGIYQATLVYSNDDLGKVYRNCKELGHVR